MSRRIAAGPFTLVPPPDWSLATPVAGTDAIVLAPEPMAGGFRPNLVCSSEPIRASQAKLSTLTLAGHQVMLGDYHLVDVAAWDRPIQDGRRFEYLHRQAGTLLHCVQFTTIVGDRAGHLVFTCAEGQLPALDAGILACIDTCEVAP